MKNVSMAAVNASPDTNAVKAVVIRPVPADFTAAEIRASAFANLKSVPKTAHGMRSDAAVFVRPAMNIAAELVIRLVREQA